MIRALQTRNRFSATSVDQLPHHVVAHAMYGHYFMFLDPRHRPHLLGWSRARTRSRPTAAS
jgi:hypothetical protein